MIQLDRTKNTTEILAIPFGIDIDKVKEVFGSKNEALFLRVQQTKMYQRYDEELSFKRDLYDIIFNYIPIEKRIVTRPKLFGLIKPKDGRGLEGEWNDYGHALLSICDYIGSHLSPEQNVFYYGEPWWTINTLLRENGSPLNLERMIKNSPVFDTPFDENGISCNYYNKDEVKELLFFVLKIESKINKENPELVNFYNTLKEGLDYCAKNNYDLVSFSYEEDDLD